MYIVIIKVEYKVSSKFIYFVYITSFCKSTKKYQLQQIIN